MSSTSSRQAARDFWVCLAFAIVQVTGGFLLLARGLDLLDGRGLQAAWSGLLFVPAGFILLVAGAFFGWAARAAFAIWRAS